LYIVLEKELLRLTKNPSLTSYLKHVDVDERKKERKKDKAMKMKYAKQ